MKKVSFVLGKRGGTDCILPLIEMCSKEWETQVVLTDQHTLSLFGRTADRVGTSQAIERIILPSIQKNDKDYSRSYSFGYLVMELSRIWERNKPDLLVLFGDRGESLAAALVAVHMRIPIAHIQAGDETGGIDDDIRWAITNMSDFLFPCNDMAYGNLWTFFRHTRKDTNCILPYEGIAGDPHVDRIVAGSFTPWSEVSKNLSLKKDVSTAVFLMHPDTLRADPKIDEKDALAILHEIRKRFAQVVACYPSTDSGYNAILRALHEQEGTHVPNNTFLLKKNIPYEDFLGLLSGASLLIGNSSSGIIEAPYLGTAVIDVGDRQRNRTRSPGIVNHIQSPVVCAELQTALSTLPTRSSVSERTTALYGTGHANNNIFRAFKSLKILKKDSSDDTQT